MQHDPPTHSVPLTPPPTHLAPLLLPPPPHTHIHPPKMPVRLLLESSRSVRGLPLEAFRSALPVQS